MGGRSLEMLTVRLHPKLEARLNRLAKRTGRTKTYYAKKAIEEFLEEQEDYLIALTRLEGKLPGIPLEEVVKKLGLES
jgi:RHH-type transcriptional regulator, rel operon repressor / antitoxin RelB